MFFFFIATFQAFLASCQLLLPIKLPMSYPDFSLHFVFLFPCVTHNSRTNPLEMFSMQRSPWELLLAAPNFTSLKGFVSF